MIVTRLARQIALLMTLIAVVQWLIPESPGLSTPAWAETTDEYWQKFQPLQQRQAWADIEILLQRAVAEHPDTEWFYSNLVYAQRELKKYDDALQTGRLGYGRFPQSDSIRRALAYALCSKANQIMADQKNESEAQSESEKTEAIKYTREAIELHSDQSTLAYHGAALTHAGQFDEAIRVLTSALTEYPESNWIRGNLVNAYIQKGSRLTEKEDYPAALGMYEQAYRLKPETDYVILWYALALRNTGEYARAVEMLKQGGQMHPNYEPFQNNLSWSLLLYAESLQDSDPERALEILKEAYDYDPRYREAVRRYANGLVDAKQYDRALNVLQQGMRNISENDSFCWPMSVAYREYAQELVQESKQSQALQISRGIRDYINGKPDCDNVLLIAIDKNFAMLNAFEEAIPLLEELAARYRSHSVYSQRAGFHINRYAVRLRTTGHTEQAATMRDRANVHLRRAMDVYERNHPGRPVVRDVHFPLRDMTMVVASHDSGGTHSGYGKYCYDFITVGPEGAPIRPDTQGNALNDFYGFGASVYAVREGVVDVSKDTDPDFAPNAVQYETDGNFVRIKHADGTYSWYVHLKQDSVTVNAGDRVRAGQKIGELGNSGMSVSPHLHFCMISDDYVSLDFRFESLRIRRTLTDAPRTTTDALQMGWLVQPVP